MGDSEKNAFMRGQKTLEINPHHPLIQELKTLVRLEVTNLLPLYTLSLNLQMPAHCLPQAQAVSAGDMASELRICTTYGSAQRI
jgi:HSP90 family molecular chaperone